MEQLISGLNKNLFLTADKDGNVIIFPLEGADHKFIKLQGLSALIARAIHKNELEKVRSEILQEYDVTPEQLEQDVNNLVSKLRELGFIA